MKRIRAQDVLQLSLKYICVQSYHFSLDALTFNILDVNKYNHSKAICKHIFLQETGLLEVRFRLMHIELRSTRTTGFTPVASLHVDILY